MLMHITGILNSIKNPNKGQKTKR